MGAFGGGYSLYSLLVEEGDDFLVSCPFHDQLMT
jgi:hypothetical protein